MVEKLLTNWMSICLYTFVRVREAGVGAGLGEAGWEGLTPPPPWWGQGSQPHSFWPPGSSDTPAQQVSVTLGPLRPVPLPSVGHAPYSSVSCPSSAPGGPHSLSLP